MYQHHILPEIINFHCSSTVAVTEMNIPGLTEYLAHPELCVCTLQGKLPAVLRVSVTLDTASDRFLEQRAAPSLGMLTLHGWIDVQSVAVL